MNYWDLLSYGLACGGDVGGYPVEMEVERIRILGWNGFTFFTVWPAQDRGAVVPHRYVLTKAPQ
jgi:hypothetical protein